MLYGIIYLFIYGVHQLGTGGRTPGSVHRRQSLYEVFRCNPTVCFAYYKSQNKQKHLPNKEFMISSGFRIQNEPCSVNPCISCR